VIKISSILLFLFFLINFSIPDFYIECNKKIAPVPAFSIVEVYDTGFRAVEAEGKLPTMWGRMKAE
jgi:hypothetical protein